MERVLEIGNTQLTASSCLYGSFITQVPLRDYITGIWAMEKPDIPLPDDMLDLAVTAVLCTKAEEIVGLAQFWSMDEKERFVLILAKLFGICPKPGD